MGYRGNPTWGLCTVNTWWNEMGESNFMVQGELFKLQIELLMRRVLSSRKKGNGRGK